ncbi:unnamed protein product [Brassicogethes aeneus]|uniref:Equilibrative nucleoside transporter 3 n=1 Tax=Brassicogethes aeneus TaxID=1431903 RepID=A0A9P0BFB1_BRAAE|nr:unnamed protein product [Brassicogethes aeneus]
MAYSVNTTPLLQECSSESEDDLNSVPNEVNFKETRGIFHSEPKDKYNKTYFIFYLLGIVTLLPWNFFITADDYWMYKFRDVNNTKGLGERMVTKRTPMQASFTSYVSVCSAIPTLVFLVLNTLLMEKISLNKRFLGSLISMLILFLITLGFVSVDTDTWQKDFFAITLLTIVLLNVSSAILSGSLFGVIGKFSPVYITATIGGQALGGIFAAIAEIVSLSIGASSIHSAYMYFGIGSITIIITIICYIILYKSTHFKHHVFKKMELDYQVDSLGMQTLSYKVVLKKIWVYGFTLMICFLFTMAVFPGIAVLIESEGKGHGNKWNDVFFVPTICYLLFSVGDYFGRIIAGKLLRPKSGTILLILCLSRFIFIPLIMLCNAHPRKYWGVVFDKDYEYILITIACSLSNGYLANITAIYAPKVVENHEKELASMMITVFLGIGLAFGSVISLILVKFL